jgi:hypothetical protein
MKFHKQLSLLTALLSGWRLLSSDWVLVDGHALHLLGIARDMGVWRSHLNVYVNETRLPWHTDEQEETLPPLNSAELDQLLDTFDAGLALHLIPANRYFIRGLQVTEYMLPSGERVPIVSLVGQLQLWVWRAFEFALKFDKGTEYCAISRLRAQRLESIHLDQDSKERRIVLALRRGYVALADGMLEEAQTFFAEAAELSSGLTD